MREILCLRRLPYCSYLRAAATVCAVDVGLLPNLLAGPLPPTLFCPPGSRSQSPVCCGAPLHSTGVVRGRQLQNLTREEGGGGGGEGGYFISGGGGSFIFAVNNTLPPALNLSATTTRHSILPILAIAADAPHPPPSLFCHPD